jgi:hypothetical protein
MAVIQPFVKRVHELGNQLNHWMDNVNKGTEGTFMALEGTLKTLEGILLSTGRVMHTAIIIWGAVASALFAYILTLIAEQLTGVPVRSWSCVTRIPLLLGIAASIMAPWLWLAHSSGPPITSANSGLIVRSARFGRDKGARIFTDVRTDPIEKLLVRDGWAIDAIGLGSKGVERLHGGRGGVKRVLSLRKGEYVTGVSGDLIRADWWGGAVALHSLKFTTSEGVWRAGAQGFGPKQAAFGGFSATAPAGFCLTGIEGSYDDGVKELTLVWGPIVGSE